MLVACASDPVAALGISPSAWPLPRQQGHARASTEYGIIMNESSTPATPATGEAELDPRVAQLERRIAELEATHRESMIRAELKAEAIRAGMIDLDGLKLADPTSVVVGEDGQVQGADTVMKMLRRMKPWLFGSPSTSSAAAAPTAQPPEPKLATKMSQSEWQAARAALLKHR
jgi:hypothetical protein